MASSSEEAGPLTRGRRARDKVCAWPGQGWSSSLDLHQCKGKHSPAQYLHYSGQGKNVVAAVNSPDGRTFMQGFGLLLQLTLCISFIFFFFSPPFRDV